MTHISRRSLLTAGLGLPVLAAVSGCRPSGMQPTVLRVTNWGGAGDDSEFARLGRTLIEEFEAAHPGVDVRVEGIPGSGEYVRKVLLSVIAKAEPDVMWLDASSAAVFINNDVLLDLTPKMNATSDFNIEDFWPNVVNIARRGERNYAVPVGFTPMVLYYNKKLFREGGVPYPREGWTFEEFLDAAKKLTKGDQYGFQFSTWMPGWVMWIWNNGGDVLSPDGSKASGYLDSDQNVETFNFFRRILNEEKVSPSLSQRTAAGFDFFANGKAAMNVSGHWSMVDYRRASAGREVQKTLTLEDVGVAPMPTNVGESKTVMYQAGLAVLRNAKHPDLAWEYVKFFTSYDVQSRYNASGIEICGRMDVAQKNAVGEAEEMFVKIVPGARRPWGSLVEGYDEVERVGESALKNVLDQGVDSREALRSAAAEIDRFFAKR